MKLTTTEREVFWQYLIHASEHISNPTPWTEIWCGACAMRDFTFYLVATRIMACIRRLLPSQHPESWPNSDDSSSKLDR